MLQGFSSLLFYWDDREHTFHVKNDIHVAHLSLLSLNDILSRFIHAANCLQLVEGFVQHIRMYSQMYPPTVKAFTDSVFERLKVHDSLLRKQNIAALLACISAFQTFW